MTMRVLQAIAGADVGGAETYFVDLMKGLHEAGLELEVVIRQNAARAAALREAGIEPIELAFGGYFDFVTRGALALKIAAFKPDVVQTWMSRATRHMPRGKFVHVGWLGGYYKPRNFRHCHHVVGVTPDIVSHLRQNGGWPEERSHYIPTLAVCEPADPLDRAEFATPDDAPLLIALGRLHKQKGYDVLLKAVAEVPEAYLWIAGEGPSRGALEQLRDDLGLSPRVRFLGWRSDREALLKTADICVMPSRYDSFGNVMVEAWAQDRPVITAAAAGPLGRIEDGKNGLMVPIDDTGALADATRRLIGDRALRARIAAAGRAIYEGEYTKEAVVARYLEFFDMVADR
jgi:glycosyltransferase involved in cell wall biosynthesis